MKYLYNISVLHPTTGKYLTLNFVADSLVYITGFLSSELRCSAEDWLSGIQMVLDGKEVFWDSGFGNAYSLEITTKNSRVNFLYHEENEPDHCTIETIELKTIIELWVKELEKYSVVEKQNYQEIDPIFGIYTFLATHFHSKIESSDDAVAEITTRRDRTYIKKATATIKTFLQSKNPVEQKNSYIILCADGINFGSLNMPPLKWLESIQKKLDDHLWKTSWLGKVGSQIKKIWENTTKA